MEKFIVKKTSLEESLKVFPKIVEFNRKEYGTVEYCNNRIKDIDNLILSAYVDEENVGYLIGYEKEGALYCWVAGVEPKYRRKGILTAMMKEFEAYAKKQGYKKMTLKTMNDKREMLSYMVKNNWNFIEVIPSEIIIENEILLEKEL